MWDAFLYFRVKFKHPMKQLLLLLSIAFLFSCKETSSNASTKEATQTLNDSTVQEREYAVLDSKVLDAEALWKSLDRKSVV